MASFDTVRNITSFRECRDEVIPRKIMGRILEAGRHAPSPRNIQSIEFIVVEDDHKLETLANATGDDRIADAPTAIILVSDLERMARKLGDDQARSASLGESAISIQNMRLVAEENDISSVWVSGFNEDAVSQQFRVPEGKLATSVLALAYTDNPVPQDRKFRLNQICYYDDYGNQIQSAFDGLHWSGFGEEKKVFEKKAQGSLGHIRRKLRKVL